MVVRCKTSYTGLFSFLAIPLLMGDIMIEFMNMIDINGRIDKNLFGDPHIYVIYSSVEIMITTVTTTTATTMATEPNNNNNNNNGGEGGGGEGGEGNNNNNMNSRSLFGNSRWRPGIRSVFGQKPI